jgi:hypothetical protein
MNNKNEKHYKDNLNTQQRLRSNSQTTISSTTTSTSFSTVARKPTTVIIPHHTVTYNDSNENKEPWMQRYSQTDFEKLHQLIYKYIDHITSLSNNHDHEFTKRWLFLKNLNSKYKMTENMSWRTMKFCLGIDELNQYKDFILLCPTINNYLRIKNNANIKNTLDVGVIPQPFKQIETDPQEYQVSQHEASINHDTHTTHDECDEDEHEPADDTTPKITNIQEILTVILPYMEAYVANHPTQPYSRLCTEWFSQGFAQAITFNEISRICKITDLAEFYLLLKSSPPFKSKLHFHWDGDQITYTVIDEQHEIRNNHDNFTFIHNDKDLQFFHQQVFKHIQTWTTSEDHNYQYLAIAWKVAIAEGITENSSWDEIKSIMDLISYRDYYYHIKYCPYLETYFNIEWDANHQSVKYQITHESKSPTPLHATTIFNTPITKNSGEPNLFFPQDLNVESNHHQDTNNQCVATLRPSDNKSDHSWDIYDPYEDWESNITTNHFEYIHNMLYHYIEQWMHLPQTKSHPLYSEWLKVKYNGLTSITPWTKVQQLLNVTTYQDYITYMKTCPHIEHSLHLVFDQTNGFIRYKYKQQPQLTHIEQGMDTISKIYQKFTVVTNDFDHKFQHIKRVIDETNTNIVYYQQTIKNQVSQGNQQLTSLLHQHQKSFVDHAGKTFTDLTTNANSFMEQHISSFRTRLSNLTETNILSLDDKTKECQKKLEDQLEQCIQEINRHSEAALENILTQAQQPSQPHQHPEHKQRSTLFPNADPSLYTQPLRAKHNPYDAPWNTTTQQQSSSEPCDSHQISDDEWGRFGPKDNYTDQSEPKPLPPLYAYKMTSQVKVPYAGRESSYTWYYTSGVQFNNMVSY